MKKNKNIAIVGGGGVTAVMTALACARKGISVDFFSMTWITMSSRPLWGVIVCGEAFMKITRA